MDQLALQFSELAKQFAPQVLSAALDAVRIQAWSRVADGGFFLLVGLLLAMVCWKWLCLIIDRCWDEMAYLPWALLALVAGIFLCVGAWQLIDPWTWAAFAHPDAWLAAKALGI